VPVTAAIPALCAGRPSAACHCQPYARASRRPSYLGQIPTLTIARSPLDAGQTHVMIDRHDRPIADFRD